MKMIYRLLKRLIWPIMVGLSQGVVGVAFADDGTSPSFEGRWVNDRGSHMVLSVNEGRVTGLYQTHVGKPDKSQSFPLIGFSEDDQIVFSVNFKGYGSMTSWTGQMSEDETGTYIRTLWHLTRNIEDDEEEVDLWKSVTAGFSVFRPVKPD